MELNLCMVCWKGEFFSQVMEELICESGYVLYCMFINTSLSWFKMGDVQMEWVFV